MSRKLAKAIVLDASVLLALLYQETGAATVREALLDGNNLIYLSAVNLCEVETKLVQGRATSAQILASTVPFLRYVIPFDGEQSLKAAELSRTTKSLGLSLGDRACLALGLSKGAIVWTTDRAWLKVEAGVRIELIRD